MLYDIHANNYEEAYSDINAAFLLSLFEIIRRRYPKYFKFLKRTDHNLITIQQVYSATIQRRTDYKFNGVLQPLEWFTINDFLDCADFINNQDELTISLFNGRCIINRQPDADIIFDILRQTVYPQYEGHPAAARI